MSTGTLDAPTPAGFVEPQFPVRAINNGNTEVVLKWDGQRYRIPAGGFNIVPFDAMARVVGNPNLVGIERQAEWERLRMFHSLGTIDNPDLDPHYPLQFFTIDGDQITTVLDNPEGTHLVPQQSNLVDQQFLLQTIERLTRQVSALQQQADANVRADIAESMGFDVGPDTPPTSASRPDPTSPPPRSDHGGAIPNASGQVTYANPADDPAIAATAALDHPPSVPDNTPVDSGESPVPDAGQDKPKTVRVGPKAQGKKE